MLARRLTVACLGLSLAILPGCYKGAMEAEKARADAAEAKARELETQLSAARSEAGAAKSVAEQLKSSAALVTIVNGQVVGREQMRLSERGEYVRHGMRSRPTSVIRFENGALADQHMVVNRDDGKPNFEGDVRGSRPDGDWIWYSKDGKPGTKEVWQGGRLADVMNASVAADGKVTWKSVSKSERDAWAKATAPIFMNLPELIRDTTPPAPPTPPPGAPKGATTPTKGATPPVKGPTPAPKKAP